MKPERVACWILAGLLGACGSPALAQSKIGFVSLERILKEAAPAQRAQKLLEQEFAKRGQDLAKTAEQLKKLQENLERNSVTMGDSERQKREREFGELNRDFQRKQREFNEDLAQRRNQELSEVIKRANLAVRRIAEAEKLDVVLQNEQVVWASPRIDITDKVIKAIDDTRAGK
ncbi:MAG: OmpH family outer membrane protein [Burkholderiales bacterium]